jgi:hypothetical protein
MIPFRHQLVPCASYRNQFGSRLDELQCRSKLVDRAKSIPYAVNKQCGSFKAWEMAGP